MAKIGKRVAVATLGVLLVSGGLGTVAVMKTSFARETDPAALAQSQPMSFEMPDLSASQEDLGQTQHGCQKPDMPQWAQKAKPDQARQVMLLRGLYDLFRYQDILERTDCSCGIEYPNWNDANERYQALAPDLDHAGLFRSSRQIVQEVGRIQKSALKICRQERGG